MSKGSRLVPQCFKGVRETLEGQVRVKGWITRDQGLRLDINEGWLSLRWVYIRLSILYELGLALGYQVGNNLNGHGQIKDLGFRKGQGWLNR